jgi:quercetin dioxygenase-like cupin family protein
MGLDHYRAVQPGEGVTYDFPALGMTIVFLARSEDTDGAYSVFESIHRPGSGAPLHVHRQRHETAYVVAGEFLIRNQGEPVRRIGPGAYVHFPKGLPHAFKCVGSATGKLLFLMQPGGYEQLFAKAHQVLGSSASPDRDALVAISKEYDAEIVGPMIEEEG